MGELVFSERAAARTYHIDRTTIRAARQRGDLPAFRLGRRRIVYFRSDLERWIRAHAVVVEVPRS